MIERPIARNGEFFDGLFGGDLPMSSSRPAVHTIADTKEGESAEPKTA
jgi:hypothetical protein